LSTVSDRSIRLTVVPQFTNVSRSVHGNVEHVEFTYSAAIHSVVPSISAA